MTGGLLAAAVVVGFTAACSGQAPAATLLSRSSAEAHLADGILTGHLYGVGGPAPGLPRQWPGTVTITGPGIHRDVSVGASGTFSVMVPAGRYSVVGHSPLYDSGTALCQATRVVTVTGGHSTKADVFCQMR